MNQVVEMTDLRERHLDVMIKLAFDLDDAEETQRLLDEPEAELSAEEEGLADEILAKAFWKAEKREKAQKRARRKAAIRRTMPRVALIASCLILVLTIAVPIAIASSSVLRSRVMRLLIEVDEEHGRATFDFVADPDAAFDVPEEWPGAYFPSYIPDGFSYWQYDPIVMSVEYRGTDENQHIFFGEYGENTTGFSGTDGATVSYVDIHGNNAILLDGEMDNGIYTVSITWANDSKWFFVDTYDVDKDVAIKIAESVRKIVE